MPGSGTGSGSNQSGTIDLGGSGRYSLTETIVYHSNYPNGKDYTYTITYKVKAYTTMYNSFNLIKSLEQLNFSVPDGYTLKSPMWSTNKNGGGTGYNSGGTFVFYQSNNGKTTHLYAQYKLDSINENPISPIKLTYMDGKTVYTSSTLFEGDTVIIKKCTNNHDGYTFVGWDTANSAQTVVYRPGESITLEKDTTLYAVWEKETLDGQYQVKWYDADTEKEIKEPAIRNGTIGNIVTVTEEDKIIDEYIFDETNEKNVLSKELTNSETILKLYFKKKTDTSETPNDSEDPNKPSTEIENPITGDNLILTILTFTISVITITFISKKYKKIKRI